MSELIRRYAVDGSDFTRAGEASRQVKRFLKELGVDPDVVRRVSVCAYEAEINMVIHANGGEIVAVLTPLQIEMTFTDSGPGIPDVELAMQKGWSTASQSIRALGFGAGMGLPNIKKFADEVDIQTQVGTGTALTFRIYLRKD